MKTWCPFALALALLFGSARVAEADGFYYEESYGVGGSRGDVHHYLNDSFDVRAAFGMRIGSFAFETWIADDRGFAAPDANAMAVIAREGGPTGRVDLAAWGVSVKYLTPLIARLPHLELYVRGSANVAQPTGALEGYSGRGLGIGAGVQLKGKVRALGFLWTPLFFFKRGPLVTGAIFIDDGIDAYSLHRDGDPTITVEVVHFNVGFAVGSDF